MPATTTARPETRKGAGRQMLGVMMVVFMLPVLCFAGFGIVTDDAGMVWVTVGCGLLMIVAAWQNWRMQWNGLGRLLRSLCGEWMARLLLALCGAAFASGSLYAGLAAR